jgi:hypothetical protein
MHPAKKQRLSRAMVSLALHTIPLTHFLHVLVVCDARGAVHRFAASQCCVLCVRVSQCVQSTGRLDDDVDSSAAAEAAIVALASGGSPTSPFGIWDKTPSSVYIRFPGLTGRILQDSSLAHAPPVWLARCPPSALACFASAFIVRNCLLCISLHSSVHGVASEMPELISPMIQRHYVICVSGPARAAMNNPTTQRQHSQCLHRFQHVQPLVRTADDVASPAGRACRSVIQAVGWQREGLGRMSNALPGGAQDCAHRLHQVVQWFASWTPYILGSHR